MSNSPKIVSCGACNILDSNCDIVSLPVASCLPVSDEDPQCHPLMQAHVQSPQLCGMLTDVTAPFALCHSAVSNVLVA